RARRRALRRKARSSWGVWEISLYAVLLIPLSIFIAVTRSNLLDIDRVISAAATYSLLLALLVAGGATALPPLVAAASRALGGAPGGVRIAFAALLVPVVVGIERGVQPRLERVFFSERHALKRGVAGLVGQLAAAPDAEALVERAGEALDALLR